MLPTVCLHSSFSSGGEDQAEFDQAEAGDRSDGREDRRRRAHAAAGQTQREVQHDTRHARHQHPRARHRALLLGSTPHKDTPLVFLTGTETVESHDVGSLKLPGISFKNRENKI